MQQIKIFKGVENDLADFETRINQWLAESNARIVNTFGNIAPQTSTHESNRLGKGATPSDVLIVVVYEKA